MSPLIQRRVREIGRGFVLEVYYSYMNRSKGVHSYSHLHQALFDKLNAVETDYFPTDTSLQDRPPSHFDKVNHLI